MQTLGFLLQIPATDPHLGWDCVAIVDVIPGLVCLSPPPPPATCYSPPSVWPMSPKVFICSLAGRKDVFDFHHDLSKKDCSFATSQVEKGFNI